MKHYLIDTNSKACLALLVLLLGHISLIAQPVEYTFPLKKNPNERYLVDQEGKPFLYQADTGWMIFMHLTQPEVLTYLADRKAKGFTVIQTMLTGFADTVNRVGQPPFLGDADFSRPNEAYFRNVDWVLRQADSMGLLVAVAPLWQGCCGEGWGGKGRAIEQNGPEKSRQFGRYLGNRYGKFNNLLWIMGGDNDPHGDRAAIREMAQAIRAAAPHHLFTYHAASSHSSTDLWPNEAWLDVPMVYTYFRGFPKTWNPVQPDVYEVCYTEYRKAPVKPFFLGESTYEGEHEEMGSALQARKQAYWAMLSGAMGHAYGSPLWKFSPGWQQYLHLPGASSLLHLRRFFASLPWYTLTPDIAGELVTAGSGPYAANAYVTAARSTDGKIAVIYLPAGNALTVDLSKLAAKKLQAGWFNPRTGKNTSIGTYTNRQAVQFQSPDGQDWVLWFTAK